MFHLHNSSTTRELSVYLDGQCLRHECHLTYLWVTQDRTLSYREHLTKIAGKLKNRNNLLTKLAVPTWGASQRQHSAVICCGALLFSSSVLCPSLATLCSYKSGRCGVVPCTSSLVPFILHLSHGLQCSSTLNRQPYEGRLPLTRW